MLIKTVLAGYAERIRLTNALELEYIKQTKPRDTQMRIAKFNCNLEAQLSADPELRKAFDAVKLDIPA